MRGAKKLNFVKLICNVLIFAMLLPFLPQKTKALTSADAGAYTWNTLVGVRDNWNTIVHFFRLDIQFLQGTGKADNMHSVKYQKNNSSDQCWRMIENGSDYMDITGEFYGCFSDGKQTTSKTGTSNFLIYKKKDNSGKVEIKNLIKVQEKDLSSVKDYQKYYILAVNSELSFDFSEYEKAASMYFPGSYTGVLHDKGEKSPTIEIVGKTKGEKMPITRPSLTFQLYDADGWNGKIASDQNNFYFKPINLNTLDDKYLAELLKDREGSSNSTDKTPNGIRLKIAQNGKGSIVYKFGGSQWQDYIITDISIKQEDWWSVIINRVYNAKDVSGHDKCGKVTIYEDGKGKADPSYTIGEEPMVRCINNSDNGWLKQWFGKDWKMDTENPLDALNVSVDACGGVLDALNPTKMLSRMFCSVGIMLNDVATMFMKFAENWLGNVIGLKGEKCKT